MLRNKESKIALLFIGVVSVSVGTLAQPAGVDKVPTSAYPDNAASIDLPFIQFKNGGIRVNFAGYHAEAGLGGLLGGSDAKGGLHASAGTPWGPSAAAGLGGSLGGNDGSARGGLYARAGLGNGRPEAAAGLGGSLDGSGRSGSRARGGLYAGATAGGPQAVAGLGGSIDESGGRSGSSYAAATDGLTKKVAVKEVSNIQPIAPPTSDTKVYLAKSGEEEPSTTLEFSLPANQAKNAVSPSLVADAGLASSALKNDVGGPDIAVVSNVQDFEEVAYPARRYHRKRLRNAPVRKRTFYKYVTANTDPIDDLSVQPAPSDHSGRISTRQAPEDRPDSYVPYNVNPKPKSKTFFDDIFNIPISTLTAVNQLLNNKSG